MKDITNLEERVGLIMSGPISDVEKDLFIQLDMNVLKGQLADLKRELSVLEQTAKCFKDEGATIHIKKCVREYQKMISEQEQELEKVSALKALINEKIWTITGATIHITQLELKKETDITSNQT